MLCLHPCTEAILDALLPVMSASQHEEHVSGSAGVLLAASDDLERSIFRRSVVLVYEHGNRSGAKGVILSQPLGPTDPRFEPTAAPGGLPALSHFLGGPVGMPGLVYSLRGPSLYAQADQWLCVAVSSQFGQTRSNAGYSLGCSHSCLLLHRRNL